MTSEFLKLRLLPHTALRARSVCGFCVTSFSFKKEVTKKVNSDVPSETSLALPRYMEKQERSHILLSCCASNAATTRGRHRKAKWVNAILI